jgi:hypothetical protein
LTDRQAGALRTWMLRPAGALSLGDVTFANGGAYSAVITVINNTGHVVGTFNRGSDMLALSDWLGCPEGSLTLGTVRFTFTMNVVDVNAEWVNVT